MGLDLIPKVMLYSMPGMAAAAIVTFVLTSILGLWREPNTRFTCSALRRASAGLVVEST
jgi:hypothetical protein